MRTKEKSWKKSIIFVTNMDDDKASYKDLLIKLIGEKYGIQI